jgi:hypothetical protein
MMELGLKQIKEKEELNWEILICMKYCQNGKSKKMGIIKNIYVEPT